MTPTDDFPEGRPLTRNELELDALHAALWNFGARLCDDCFCPSCGARGYVVECPTCTEARA